MDRPWPFDNQWYKLEFTVVECSSGPIILTATTDREGYCLGESIQVIAHLENNSHAGVRMRSTLNESFLAEDPHIVLRRM